MKFVKQVERGELKTWGNIGMEVNFPTGQGEIEPIDL